MRILIDECVPKRLVKALLPHKASTVPQMGWAGKKNGTLLRLMEEAGFEVFITMDGHLQYQQNLKHTIVSILVLKVKTNDYDQLLLLMPSVHKTLATLKSGQLYIIH